MTHTDSLRAAAPVYKDELLNEMLERRISVADDEHLHAAVRWKTEDHLLEQVLLFLRAHCDSLEREHDHAHRRADHAPCVNDPECTRTTARCARTAARLRQLLIQELAWAREDVMEAEQLLQTLRSVHVAKRVERYRRHPRSTPELDEAAALLRDQADSAARVAALLAEDRDQLHALAFEEERAQVFLASPASTNLSRIRAMSPRQFERLISDLVARDGLDVRQRHGGPHDGGVDVVATTPGGDKLAIQCKHTTKDTPVGIAAVRELNGIAGPVHHADIAILITNSTFSKPASKFAQQQDIILLSWSALVRWATWGESLLDILELDEAAVLAA
ncbi:restriction endonuclease [Streptomyces sp. NPDC051993]|uniref:restriction endonuclease n=1 Tax=Streptomyces sp. NPDC051993 TaxID=3155286 RepID=UPI00343016AB